MTEWIDLVGNALWIVGCALALGTLSYASWQASLCDEKLAARLARRGTIRALAAAGALFCAGMALSVGRPWEAVLWGALGALCGVGLGWLVLR